VSEQSKRRPTIVLERVSKSYGTGAVAVQALQDVDLVVERGDFVAIMGASGSGKSTLMNILGCLDLPTRGRYLLAGVDVRELDDFELSYIRNRGIGLVFQSFNLIPRTTALRNVELPLVYARVPSSERRARALRALQAVGLLDRALHGPQELSGGQQQRAAIARAIVTEPTLILADEPTGNLDSHSAEEVLQVVTSLNAAGRTIVMITHERNVADCAKRIVRLSDGRIVSDERIVPVASPPPAFVPAGVPA
jgi:putative ABC transport system ATP-binding protein